MQVSFFLCNFAAQNVITNTMPKIFEYFGFVFFFYSNEHEPIHVHVTHKGCQSIFELIMDNGVLVEIRVREKAGEEPLSSKDQKTAEEFIRKYSKNIITKWIKFFVLRQAVKVQPLEPNYNYEQTLYNRSKRCGKPDCRFTVQRPNDPPSRYR